METLEYVVGEHGEKKAVIVPIEEYEELIEDLHDLRIIAERKEEGTVSMDDFKKNITPL